MKCIDLSVATNPAIVLVLSVAMRVLGVEPHLHEQGLDRSSLLVCAAALGFGGSFISLALLKWTLAGRTAALDAGLGRQA